MLCETQVMKQTLFILGGLLGLLLIKGKVSKVKTGGVINEICYTPTTLDYQKYIDEWKSGESDLGLFYSAKTHSWYLSYMQYDTPQGDIETGYKINLELKNIFSEAGVQQMV